MKIDLISKKMNQEKINSNNYCKPLIIHAHRLFQKLKTVQSSIITMINIMISILKRNCIMHLSAAIPGGGGDPGKPPVICTTTFTNPPYPKPRLFNEKLLTPLPWGQRSVLCQVNRCNISKELYRRNRIFLPKNIVAM